MGSVGQSLVRGESYIDFHTYYLIMTHNDSITDEVLKF